MKVTSILKPMIIEIASFASFLAGSAVLEKIPWLGLGFWMLSLFLLTKRK